jgi:hypothetical protein
MSDQISANICRGTATSANRERDVATVADDLSADLDQLLAQAGKRPRLAVFGIASVRIKFPRFISQRVELEADGVDSEGAARQAGPLDRALAFFDPRCRGGCRRQQRAQPAPPGWWR